MRETILICDRCGQKTSWLYEIPRPIVEGNDINLYPSMYELCEKCAKTLCSLINHYHESADIPEDVL